MILNYFLAFACVMMFKKRMEWITINKDKVDTSTDSSSKVDAWHNAN